LAAAALGFRVIANQVQHVLAFTAPSNYSSSLALYAFLLRKLAGIVCCCTYTRRARQARLSSRAHTAYLHCLRDLHLPHATHHAELICKHQLIQVRELEGIERISKL
jgi:hypothetical protein